MTELVGILNITPDSFSDGGRYSDLQAALEHADQMFEDGAALVDVGAESTRPGAIPLTDDEEWVRLEPVLGPLLNKYPGQISVDTYHPATVKRAFGIGAVIINDVTGLNNPEMVDAIVEHNAHCVVSHLPGADIQAAHQNPLPLTIGDVAKDLLDKESLLIERGVSPENIILDPGIGFGKSTDFNWLLLQTARRLPGRRVMVGYSRKRFLGSKRMELAPNIVAGRIAIKAGTAYLRVHDVAGHRSLVE